MCYQLPVQTSIRAIACLNDSSLWFAGSGGYFGYTDNNGRQWYIDSIRIDTLRPDFRSMAVLDEHTILLLNAGSPAYILKSTDQGRTWKTVYENNRKEIFFDAMRFSDAEHGFAVGDPIDGCFTLMMTDDGGDHWKEAGCGNLPEAATGEACFAASNTCLEIIGSHSWIGTGGAQSRVLSSTDHGNTWHFTNTPVIKGKPSTGIFSIDFYDQQHGIAAGGNYEEPSMNVNTIAITANGGKRWQTVVANDQTGYTSCIQYRPYACAKTLLRTSPSGMFISNDGGKNWSAIKNGEGNVSHDNYHTLQFSPTGKVAWCAGAGGKIGRILFF